MKKKSLSSIFKLKHAGVLFVALLLIASYTVSSTIRFGKDGAGQLRFGDDNGLIRNSNGKAWLPTDDGIQAAYDDLPTDGGTIYLPATTITVSVKDDIITFNSGKGNYSIIGDRTILEADTSDPGGEFDHMMIFESNEHNFTLQGVIFDGKFGEGVSYNTGIGTQAIIRNEGTYYTIRDCTFRNSPCNHVWLGYNSRHTTVEHCVFDYCGEHPIYFTGGTTTDLIMRDCTILNWGRDNINVSHAYAIKLVDVSHSLFENLYFDANQSGDADDIGIEIVGITTGNTVHNVTFRNIKLFGDTTFGYSIHDGFNRGTGSTIRDLLFEDCIIEGFENGWDFNTGTNITVKDCEVDFHNTGTGKMPQTSINCRYIDSGEDMDLQGKSLFINCDFVSPYHLNLESGDDGTVFDSCSWYGSYNQIIDFLGGSHYKFSNCYFQEAQENANGVFYNLDNTAVSDVIFDNCYFDDGVGAVAQTVFHEGDLFDNVSIINCYFAPYCDNNGLDDSDLLHCYGNIGGGLSEYVQIPGLPTEAATGNSTRVGSCYYNADDNKLYIYDSAGSGWLSVTLS